MTPSLDYLARGQGDEAAWMNISLASSPAMVFCQQILEGVDK
jgi:hypothetical protein